MTPDLEDFKDYYKHLDKLIADSTKEDLAECARLHWLCDLLFQPRDEARNILS